MAITIKVGVHEYAGIGTAGGLFSAFGPVAPIILAVIGLSAIGGSGQQVYSIINSGRCQAGNIDIAHVISRAHIKVGGAGTSRRFRSDNFVDIAVIGAGINSDK